jgi:hypothetical protein
MSADSSPVFENMAAHYGVEKSEFARSTDKSYLTSSRRCIVCLVSIECSLEAVPKVTLAFAMCVSADCKSFELGTSAVHVSNRVYNP